MLAYDLDLDGAADLIAGYATSNGGVITVTHGNPEAYAPKDPSVIKASLTGKIPATFLKEARSFPVPESPDLLAAGDFTGHGHRDLLVARNGGGLYLLEGDGKGNLSEARQISLAGNVTALASNPASQVAVAVSGASTPQLLLFDARQGFSEPASTHPLNEAATSLAWGDLGSRTGSDLAAAAGNEIFFVYRALSSHQQTDSLALGFRAESLTLGDYIWDRNARTEIAVLAENGTIHILQHGPLDTRPLTEADMPARRAQRSMNEIARFSQPHNPAALGPWHEASTLGFAASNTSDVASQSRLQSPRLASTPTHDLMLLDSGLRQLNLLDTSGAANFRSAISFASAPVAAAALPAKLNGERDFVVLTSGQTAPLMFTSAATQLVSVTTTTDEDDAGACANSSVGLGTTGPNGLLSLREAICEANNATGTVDILLPSGTYKIGLRAGGETGELQFGTKSGSNLFLIGTGTQADTAIEQINGIDRVINIDPNLVGNITATILNVTIKDGTETDGKGGSGIMAGAAGDVVTISDSTITLNSNQGQVSGGGIAFANGGTLVANSVSFTGNTAGSGGGLYFVEASGGTLQVINSYFTNNSVTGSAGGNGGGVFANLSGGSATISATQFTGNQATGSSGLGGGLYIENGAVTITNSRIVGNTAAAGGSGVYAANSGTVAAVDNWWGCNYGPGSSGCDTALADGTSSASASPWLVLSLGAASPGILPGATDQLTAAVISDSNGGSGFTIPSGTSVNFTGTLGAVNPSTAYTNLGQAMTLFTAGSSGGTAVTTASLDNQTVSSNIIVGLGPAITSANSTTFVTGTSGSFTVTATGTPTPSISKSGALPSGVTFTDKGNGTAMLSGTPASGSGGSYTLTVTAANGVAPNATQTFTLIVNGEPAFTSPNAATFPVGNSSSFTITTSGFPAPTISESGSLPSGVSFVNNGNGTATLSGTPAPGSVGTYNIPFTASNGIGNQTQTFTLTVSQAPAITSAGSTTFQVGIAGSFTITATGSPTASISESGVLPSGVTLLDNRNGTATLGGSATSGGIFSLTFTAASAAGVTSQKFTLMVNQAPAITSANNGAFVAGTKGSFTVTSLGFPAASLTESGALPSGVTFRDNKDGTATLSGTPNAAGTFSLSLTASNSVGSATQSFTLAINQTPAITSATVATFNAGASGAFTVSATGSPAPSLMEKGTLPTGVSFVDNKNGTASLSGTPASGSLGSFSISFTASNSAGSSTQDFTLTVNQTPAITSAVSASFQLGVAASFTVTTAGFPTPTLTAKGTLPAGTVFADNGNGTASLSGTPSQAGAFRITINANSTAGSASQTFTLNVATAGTVTTLASSANPASAGQSIILTATITPTVSGTPTGTVTFFDDSNPLGSSNLSGGVATLATSLTAGTHTLTAKYSGDANFAASTSSALSQVVNVAVAGDFALSLDPASARVAAGSSATYTISATPNASGFNSAIALSCAGLPSESTCSFSPASVTPGVAVATSTLTVKTTGPSAAMLQPTGIRRSRGMYAIWLVIPGMLFSTVGLAGEKRRKRLGYLFALLVIAACTLMAGCGSSGSSSSGSTAPTGGTPAGTYTITITGIAGSTSHAASVTLTVQ
jgi:hypothetical protein